MAKFEKTIKRLAELKKSQGEWREKAKRQGKPSSRIAVYDGRLNALSVAIRVLNRRRAILLDNSR